MGAIPALVISARTIKTGLKLAQGVVQTVGARRNKIVPVACAMKYLQMALVLSVSGPSAWKVIKGINDSRFISIPSQAISQLGAVSEVNVPRTRDEKNKIEEMGMYKGGTSIPWWGLKPQAIICHLYIAEEISSHE